MPELAPNGHLSSVVVGLCAGDAAATPPASRWTGTPLRVRAGTSLEVHTTLCLLHVSQSRHLPLDSVQLFALSSRDAVLLDGVLRVGVDVLEVWCRDSSRKQLVAVLVLMGKFAGIMPIGIWHRVSPGGTVLCYWEEAAAVLDDWPGVLGHAEHLAFGRAGVLAELRRRGSAARAIATSKEIQQGTDPVSGREMLNKQISRIDLSSDLAQLDRAIADPLLYP